MKIGLILPTFAESFDAALTALSEVEDAGLDGGFVYDHLWPMHRRQDPAISAYPALGALCAHRRSLTLGTLVARVGNVVPAVLVRELKTIDELTGHAFIAAIGTADEKSEEEYLGYGLEFPSADERRAELEVVASSLIAKDVEVWVGGGSSATNEVARRLGATLNLWGASLEKVQAETVKGPVSWAGKLPSDPDLARSLVEGLIAAGVTWAVFSWPTSLPFLVEVLGRAGESDGTE